MPGITVAGEPAEGDAGAGDPPCLEFAAPPPHAATSTGNTSIAPIPARRRLVILITATSLPNVPISRNVAGLSLKTLS
jgi:hypothetical protein